MSMIPEITPDQIDDWFKIGKKTSKIKTVPKSFTGGRAIDPVTLQPKQPQHHHIPHYKRKPDFHGGHDYAEEYQREEDEKLISRSSFVTGDDTISMVSSHLEALELDSTIAGTEVLPSDLAPENATQVYGVYNFNHRYDDRLPISRCKEQVVNTIESNQVTVIQGATGSGKTTQVAQYILDYYAKQNQYCNIIVTQPRRIAAISIARRVCQERNWQLGTICGYQVGLDREAGDDTRILYCTTGILLNKLINEKNMHKYTHVILDEVHERDQDTDFLLLVVRKLLRTNSRHTKVVLMSATIDPEMFAQYFAMPVRDRLEQAPVVDVEGKPFKVNEYYAEDLIQLGPIPPLEESDPHISQEARNLAVELIQHFDRLEEKEQGLDDATGFAPIRGTVLVFLPGLAEIGSLEEALFKLSAKHQLRLIPLHSTITMEEQAQVFCQPCAGFRKVILSTNIAESSITVPDIKYVIDFCLTKNLVCDFDTNYTSLQVHWASVANCTQRKGRAGRVSNGRVYRLVTRHFFEHRLPEYGTPEMRNSRFFCKKCINPPRSFNHPGDCRRHLQTFHYGFMYQCTGCGKTHTRKPDKDHNCKENSKYILAHRETGLTGIDAIQKRRSLDKEIENNIDEQINIIPRKPLSPIRDTVLNKSYNKTYHPYKRENPFKRKHQPQTTINSASQPSEEQQSEIVIKRPLEFDENSVQPGNFSDILTITPEDCEAIIETSPSIPESQSENETHELNVLSEEVKNAIDKMRPEIEEMRRWQDEKITLCVGGKCFDTTKSTLMKVPKSLISIPCGLIKKGEAKIIIDRDPSHFKFILNYLRYNCQMPAGCLPNDLQVLNQLKQEAIYYKLPKLEDCVQRKIRILQGH